MNSNPDTLLQNCKFQERFLDHSVNFIIKSEEDDKPFLQNATEHKNKDVFSFINTYYAGLASTVFQIWISSSLKSIFDFH